MVDESSSAPIAGQRAAMRSVSYWSASIDASPITSGPITSVPSMPIQPAGATMGASAAMAAAPGPRHAIPGHVRSVSSHSVRSLNRVRRVTTASPHPGSTSSRNRSSDDRVTRNNATILPCGSSSSDHADAPTASAGDVLAELTVQVRRRLRAFGNHDVASDRSALELGHRRSPLRAARRHGSGGRHRGQ